MGSLVATIEKEWAEAYRWTPEMSVGLNVAHLGGLIVALSRPLIYDAESIHAFTKNHPVIDLSGYSPAVATTSDEIRRAASDAYTGEHELVQLLRCHSSAKFEGGATWFLPIDGLAHIRSVTEAST